MRTAGNNELTVLILGSTGMVGEGVLHTCLNDPDIKSIILVNRKPCGVSHPGLKEIILDDFFQFNSLEGKIEKPDAVFFCMGISSIGKSEADYTKITYHLTMNVASFFYKLNPAIVFTYVSGTGTDSSEKGKTMWARVKGKTENDLKKIGFKNVYLFRPAYIQPIKGLRRTYKMYKILAPFYPVYKTLFPAYTNTLAEIGTAMINCVKFNPKKLILECKDISEIAKL